MIDFKRKINQIYEDLQTTGPSVRKIDDKQFFKKQISPIVNQQVKDCIEVQFFKVHDFNKKRLYQTNRKILQARIVNIISNFSNLSEAVMVGDTKKNELIKSILERMLSEIEEVTETNIKERNRVLTTAYMLVVHYLRNPLVVEQTDSQLELDLDNKTEEEEKPQNTPAENTVETPNTNAAANQQASTNQAQKSPADATSVDEISKDIASIFEKSVSDQEQALEANKVWGNVTKDEQKNNFRQTQSWLQNYTVQTVTNTPFDTPQPKFERDPGLEYDETIYKQFVDNFKMQLGKIIVDIQKKLDDYQPQSPTTQPTTPQSPTTQPTTQPETQTAQAENAVTSGQVKEQTSTPSNTPNRPTANKKTLPKEVDVQKLQQILNDIVPILSTSLQNIYQAQQKKTETKKIPEEFSDMFEAGIALYKTLAKKFEDQTDEDETKKRKWFDEVIKNIETISKNTNASSDDKKVLYDKKEYDVKGLVSIINSFSEDLYKKMF